MPRNNNAVLVVRVAKGKARVWTGEAPEGTQGATTLTPEASARLRDAINALPKGEFKTHQTALASGNTVRARGDKRIATLIREAIASQKVQPQKAAAAAGKSKRGQNRRRSQAQPQAQASGKGRPAKGTPEARDMMAKVRAARGGGKATAPATPRKRTATDLKRMTKAELAALITELQK